MLSATSLAAPLIARSLADSASIRLGADFAVIETARQSEASHAFVDKAVIEQGGAAERLGTHQLEPSARQVLSAVRLENETPRPQALLPAQAHNQYTGVERPGMETIRQSAAITRPNVIAQTIAPRMLSNRADSSLLPTGNVGDELIRSPVSVSHRSMSVFAQSGRMDLAGHREGATLSSPGDRPTEIVTSGLQLEIELLRENPYPQGGFVEIVSIHFESGLFPVGGLVIVSVSTSGDNWLTHPVESRSPSNSAPSGGTWGDVSVAGEQRATLTHLAVAAVHTVNTHADGGFVHVPGQELIVPTVGDADWQTAGSAEADVEGRMKTESNRDLAFDVDPPSMIGQSDHTDPPAGYPLGGDASEGGFVDLNAVSNTLSTPPGSTGGLATTTPLWKTPQRVLDEPAWTDSPDTDQASEKIGGVENHGQPTDQQLDESNQPEDAGEDVGVALDSAEGGMIELAAADPPAADAYFAAATSSETTGENPSVGDGGIEMDKGVGLFQAFEVASVRPQGAAESKLAAGVGIGARPTATRVVSALAADALMAEMPRLAGDKFPKQLVSHTSLIPAIVVLASLATAAGSRAVRNVCRLERWNRWSKSFLRVQ